MVVAVGVGLELGIGLLQKSETTSREGPYYTPLGMSLRYSMFILRLAMVRVPNLWCRKQHPTYNCFMKRICTNPEDATST